MLSALVQSFACMCALFPLLFAVMHSFWVVSADRAVRTVHTLDILPFCMSFLIRAVRYLHCGFVYTVLYCTVHLRTWWTTKQVNCIAQGALRCTGALHRVERFAGSGCSVLRTVLRATQGARHFIHCIFCYLQTGGDGRRLKGLDSLSVRPVIVPLEESCAAGGPGAVRPGGRRRIFCVRHSLWHLGGEGGRQLGS